MQTNRHSYAKSGFANDKVLFVAERLRAKEISMFALLKPMHLRNTFSCNLPVIGWHPGVDASASAASDDSRSESSISNRFYD